MKKILWMGILLLAITELNFAQTTPAKQNNSTAIAKKEPVKKEMSSTGSMSATARPQSAKSSSEHMKSKPADVTKPATTENTKKANTAAIKHKKRKHPLKKTH